jgi:hypothetical protein
MPRLEQRNIAADIQQGAVDLLDFHTKILIMNKIITQQKYSH